MRNRFADCAGADIVKFVIALSLSIGEAQQGSTISRFGCYKSDRFHRVAVRHGSQRAVATDRALMTCCPFTIMCNLLIFNDKKI